MRAALITPDSRGAIALVDMPGRDGTGQLTWMQGQVGGWIEHVTLLDLRAEDPDLAIGFYINEEGKLDGLPENWTATRIWFGMRATDVGFPSPLPDVLVGPALLTASDMRTGEEAELPDDVLDQLRERGYTITHQEDQ